jgi:hypothetical protein
VDSAAGCAAIASMASARIDFSVQLSILDDSILDLLRNARSQGLRRVILSQIANSRSQPEIKSNVDQIRDCGVEFFIQVLLCDGHGATAAGDLCALTRPGKALRCWTNLIPRKF